MSTLAFIGFLAILLVLVLGLRRWRRQHEPHAGGGLAARRAILRWAWRLFRREWKQQLLLFSLLTVAVAAAVSSVTIAYNAHSTDSDFGSANHQLVFDGSDSQALNAGLAAAKARFGTIEVIGNRKAQIPGSVEAIDVRTQRPGGAYGGKLLALRRGSFPTRGDEVAVTDGVAKTFQLRLGGALVIDGQRRTVVGIVENPQNLSDDFALVPAASAGRPDSVTVLVDATPASFDSFRQHLSSVARSALLGYRARPSGQATSALVMFAVASAFLILVSLIAAAGFAVIAHRRLRQLGMLAAVGATEKQLRLVLAANGALVGAVGALLGTIAGSLLWVAIAPTLEPIVHHRIDRLHLPWMLIALALLSAFLAATAAAWWPGRAVARVPITLALTARPPKPKPVHRSALLGAVLIAAGVIALGFAHRSSPPLIVAGMLATITGTLLITSLAVRALAATAGPMPVAVRLALRDLGRYRARSSAALAAISLALGIAASVVVVSNAEARRIAAQPPNLSDQQIRVYPGPSGLPDLPTPRTPTELARLSIHVQRLATYLDHAAVTPLSVATEPGVRPQGSGDSEGIPTMQLTRRSDTNTYSTASVLYVATPAVLSFLKIDPATIDPSTNFLAAPNLNTADMTIPDLTTRRNLKLTHVQRFQIPQVLLGYPDASNQLAPPSFLTVNALRRYGFKPVSSGWLVVSKRPLTSTQIANARSLAAQAGLTIETRRQNASMARVIGGAIAVGTLLALAILAMTTGLIRSEAASDLRTLAAMGATSRTRRTITAATAAGLALLGALLGIAGAYVTLLAVYLTDLTYLSHAPIHYLAITAIGVPAIAAGAGWLLAGRQPPSIARPAIE